MNPSDIRLLEFITRLTYNIEGLSGELKLYFSQFLTFHFSKTLAKNQIEHVENKKASLVFKNEAEIQNASSSFSAEDKLWSIAAIQLLQVEAEKMDDRVISRKIGLLIKDLTSVLGLENETEKIFRKRQQIEQEIHQFENRPVIKIPASIWPLTLDFILRCVFLLSISYLELDKVYLTGFNSFLIPIFILAAASLVGKRQKKANLSLLDVYGGAQLYKIEYQVSTGQYTWLAFFLGTSVFISYLLPEQLHFLAFFGLTFYYLIYLRFFRLGKIKENDLVKQLENKTLDAQTLNVDQNDEVIVALETKLNSSTSRLEAYVLESALFGALSFSGFLQIMATDLVTFTDLENFASYIFSTAQAFIHLDWDTFNTGIAELSNKKSLFCLVSVESLICSIFFLAVIASRLRFSDIADKVRTAINLAKAYNMKEEALHDEQEITGKKIGRLESLTTKVNEQLHLATLVLEEINPVMLYMQYFRNAGILVFLIILISSSLFITSVLGWTFLVLVLATYFYFNRATLNNQFKSLFLSFRIRFVKQGYWLFIIIFIVQLLAYTLRIFFHMSRSDLLLALSNFLIGLYVFAWLILAAHVDEQFGEIEPTQQDLSRQSRWRFVKNTMAVLILICGIAMAFKQLHLDGANVMMMMSMSLLAILMYFVGYYLTKIRWLGIICGNLMAVASIGIMFKNLHLLGANEMLLISLSAFAIFIPIIIWKRKVFHFLLIRFCIAGFIISIYYFPFFHKLPLSLQVAYVHETSSVSKIMNVLEGNDHDTFLIDSSALDIGIKKSDWYCNEYGVKHGFTNVYDILIEEYHSYASLILYRNDELKEKDFALLHLALEAAREEKKILKLFNYKPLVDEDPRFSTKPIEMESQVLIAMGKKEEAIQSLENIIQSVSDENLRETLRARIATIKTQTQ